MKELRWLLRVDGYRHECFIEPMRWEDSNVIEFKITKYLGENYINSYKEKCVDYFNNNIIDITLEVLDVTGIAINKYRFSDCEVLNFDYDDKILIVKQ